MSHLSPEDVKHHVKVYVRVFLALALLTVATVAVSYLHLPIVAAIHCGTAPNSAGRYAE